MAVSTIFCLFAFLAYATSANVTRCYNCESITNKDCEDPFSAESTSVECSTLPYGRKDIYSAVDNVFNREKADIPFNYGCVKLKIESGSESAILRTCAMVSTNIDEPCELLTTTGVTKCNYCTKDNCNSGALHGVSAILLGVILIFVLRF